MLEQNQRCGRVVWELREDIPGLVIREHVYSVASSLGAARSPFLGPSFALYPESDERAHHAAELDRLFLGQVAEMLYLHLAVRVLVNGQGIDDPDGVIVVETLKLGDYLAVELRVVEPRTIS